MEKNLFKLEDWPLRKQRPVQIKVDPAFQKFILNEFPSAHSNAERTRTLLDRLLYGNNGNKGEDKKNVKK